MSVKTYIIAEVGGNHDGDLAKAIELVKQAKLAGANAVKFQHYKAEKLVLPSMPSVPLARKKFKKQIDRFKSLELSFENTLKIISECRKQKIDFLTTAYDQSLLSKFEKYMKFIKIGSGDLTHHKLIKDAVSYKKPIILSTGMATYDEIKKAVLLIPSKQRILLHCVSIYPLPHKKVNIMNIKRLMNLYKNIPVGYSDHTIGYDACLLAVSLGAKFLEKHFTLNSKLDYGDHSLSLDPKEFKKMTDKIKIIHEMLGTPEKPISGEEKFKKFLRRGIYANKNLSKGKKINEKDFDLLRPENSISAKEFKKILNKRLIKNIKKGQELKKIFLDRTS